MPAAASDAMFMFAQKDLVDHEERMDERLAALYGDVDDDKCSFHEVTRRFAMRHLTFLNISPS